jgi:hypothetical protein
MLVAKKIFAGGTCSFANDDILMTVVATNGAGSTDLGLNPKTASLPNSFTTRSDQEGRYERRAGASPKIWGSPDWETPEKRDFCSHF